MGPRTISTGSKASSTAAVLAVAAAGGVRRLSPLTGVSQTTIDAFTTADGVRSQVLWAPSARTLTFRSAGGDRSPRDPSEPGNNWQLLAARGVGS